MNTTTDVNLSSTASAKDTENATVFGIVGVWRFISYRRRDIKTDIASDVFGDKPRGWLIYTIEGRMMVIVIPEHRRILQSDVDRIEHHEKMVSYSGRYTIPEAGLVIHHVDVAWNESWVGRDLVRSFFIDGDRLTITTAPTKYAVGGGDQISTLILERSSA